ncbi:helix-turn-helix domain-containing protein [Phyllobacterium sp. P5_D12]
MPVYHSKKIDIEIGAKLKEPRLQAGMSQEKFGRAMGFSYAQVQKYEQGKNRIAVSTLVGWAPTLWTSFYVLCRGWRQ